MKKLSVIIPIYKVEKYLNECINSVICQTYKNLEIILVDDGSPDSCPQMCDDWARKDSRIKVIHKPNGGLSSARNAGINVATGDYIMFIDADDFLIDENCIEKIAQIISKDNKQCYLSPFKYFIKNQLSISDKYVVDRDLFRNPLETIYASLVYNNNLSISAWAKVIEREFLTRNNIYYQEKILSEDIPWTINIFRCNPSLGFIPFSYYAYRQNVENSITQKKCEVLLDAQLKIIYQLLDDNEAMNNKYKDLEFAYLAFIWCVAFSMIPDIKKEEQKKYYKKFKDLQFLLKYNKSNKVKAIRLMYFILGAKFTANLLYKYRRKRDIRNLK